MLLGLTRALRAAGVSVSQDRAQAFLEATLLLGIGDGRAVHRAGRTTLCSAPEDLARFDEVFAAWFGSNRGLPNRSLPEASVVTTLGDLGPTDDPTEGDSQQLPVKASSTELLRQRDLAALSDAERQLLTGLFSRLALQQPKRPGARRTPARHGVIDARRTMRSSLRRMGEPAELAWRRHTPRPRRVVLLLDVSGSMAGYAEALLRLAHRICVSTTASPRAIEVFTLGTRLTRITKALHRPDAEQALVGAGAAVPDWSGGTRLGETLQAFLDQWGARGVARGAVVVIFSDGWERGDATLLAEQAERLHRFAHRVVWVNPHLGKAGYEPIQGGIVAVLPHVDEFLAGHSMATFERVLEVIARA